MLGPNRNCKIETLLRDAIAKVISQQIKDPRIGSLVSVANVKLSKDKSFAKIYITMLGDDGEHVEAVKVLNNAVGFFRTELAKRVDLKYIPNIKFVMDRTIVDGMKLSNLINS
ncbi:MAG: 30S ribosome-binding factor RbfA [Legionellales bacterium]|nr:30S ribosome-binding factor RbfA [Legionellales bacterium]